MFSSLQRTTLCLLRVLPTLLDFNMVVPGGTKNIQTIFDHCSCVLKSPSYRLSTEGHWFWPGRGGSSHNGTGKVPNAVRSGYLRQLALPSWFSRPGIAWLRWFPTSLCLGWQRNIWRWYSYAWDKTVSLLSGAIHPLSHYLSDISIQDSTIPSTGSLVTAVNPKGQREISDGRHLASSGLQKLLDESRLYIQALLPYLDPGTPT